MGEWTDSYKASVRSNEHMSQPKTKIFDGINYNVGIDEDGREYAKTYNEKHKVWVRFIFAPVENAETVHSVLDILKREYTDKVLYGR